MVKVRKGCYEVDVEDELSVSPLETWVGLLPLGHPR
jgi:hypothetical protein